MIQVNNKIVKACQRLNFACCKSKRNKVPAANKTVTRAKISIQVRITTRPKDRTKTVRKARLSVVNQLPKKISMRVMGAVNPMSINSRKLPAIIQTLNA